MMTMPKCHDCGKFCRPVAWKRIYSGALLEPQEEIYKCATCAEKNGSFAPQHGIKPEYSCGEFPAVLPAPTFPDGMTAEDDRRFLELTSGLTHNVERNRDARHHRAVPVDGSVRPQAEEEA